MSAKRRTRLLQLAETYDFLILEDDAYGELGFTDIPPPLKAMDQNGGAVCRFIIKSHRPGYEDRLDCRGRRIHHGIVMVKRLSTRFPKR